MNIVDMCMHHKKYELKFELDSEKWRSFNPEIKDIVHHNWFSAKFLNENGDALNEEINSIPDDKGGIYLFLLKPEVVPQTHLYILYIGRARRREGYSLRKRCRTYFTDTRPKIAYMREIWGKDLFIKYLPLNDDTIIEKVERELLRVIIPPCNTQIPDYDVIIGEDEKVLRGE